MASQDANQVVVGGNGKVYVAPFATAVIPTSPTAALNSVFKEVGFVSEDGVSFTDAQDVEDVEAWQSFYPIRKVVTSKESTIEFVMRQWEKNTVKLAFGGGTITIATGIATYVPPVPGVLDYRAMVIEWVDGTKNYRLVAPKGMVTGEVSTEITRSSAADLPVAFSCTPSGAPTPGTPASFPWHLLTDDPALLSTT